MARKRGSEHVLIVDDEESIRTTLPTILSERGFAVTAVGSISEALAKVNEKKFDVLVSDLNIHKPGTVFWLSPSCIYSSRSA